MMMERIFRGFSSQSIQNGIPTTVRLEQWSWKRTKKFCFLQTCAVRLGELRLDRRKFYEIKLHALSHVYKKMDVNDRRLLVTSFINSFITSFIIFQCLLIWISLCSNARNSTNRVYGRILIRLGYHKPEDLSFGD